jgi:hypothetical protein
MVRTIIPEIIADAAAIPSVVGVPEKNRFTNNIIMLEDCLESNIKWHANMLHSLGAINLLQLLH